jgi:hypothetical protein
VNVIVTRRPSSLAEQSRVSMPGPISDTSDGAVATEVAGAAASLRVSTAERNQGVSGSSSGKT